MTPSQYTVGDDFSQANLVVEDLDTGGISLERLDNELRKVAEEKMPQPAK